MEAKQWTGLTLLAVVVAVAVFLDMSGRERQPRHFVIHFSGGLAIEKEDAPLVDVIASHLHKVPAYRAAIEGHANPRGDAAVNHELSARRAALIKASLVKLGVAEDRIFTMALGGKQPLERQPDEGNRSYNRRLRRVEITLKVR